MGAPRSHLPVQLNSFIGREREIGEVKRLLATTRLLTLTGAGGCGKTSLALRVARDVRETYAAGACWVELAPLADPALVPQVVVHAFGIVAQPHCTPAESLLDFLGDKELLLLLDNCEHLIGACAELATLLLQHCLHARILATSREPLNVAGEVAWAVPSLELPMPGAQLPTSILERYDAVQLFVERATVVVPGFRLTDRNAGAVARVCQRLDGIPLAIELAAACVKVLSVEQIAARLDDMLQLLIDGKRSAPPRQQTLRATLDWSHDQLTVPEQELFRRLAVFAGGFTLEAVEAIAAGDSVPVDGVLSRLSQLVDKSLLIKYEQDGEARFRLLEPIRQYAWTQLLAAREVESFGRRHLEFYVQVAEHAQPKLLGAEQTVWLRRLDQDLDNIRTAIAWAGEREAVESGLRLVTALRWFWFWRGYWREATSYFSDLLARPKAAPLKPPLSALRARAENTVAWMLHNTGEYARAEPLLAEAIALGDLVDDQSIIAEALSIKAEVAYRQRARAAGRAYFDESLARSRAAGDIELTARTLQRRGWNVWLCGEVAQARADVEEALSTFRMLGHQTGIAWSLSTGGAFAMHRGDYAAARDLEEECLAISRTLGHKNQTANALQRLAHILQQVGEYAHGRVLCEEALTLYRELGDHFSCAQCLWILSNLTRLLGEENEARTLAEEGLRIARELRISHLEAHNLAALGRVALAQGDYVTARARFEQSLRIREQNENRLDVPVALRDLGHLAFCQADLASASRCCEQALSISREIGDHLVVPDALRMSAHIAVYQGDLARARARVCEGLTANRERKFTFGLIRDLPACAALACARGDLWRAAHLLAAAEALLEGLHIGLEAAEAAAYDRTLTALRVQLDGPSFDEVWATGRALTLEQALSEAEQIASLQPAAVVARAAEPQHHDPNALTPREREVLRLVAQRLTDAEIAEKLVISPRTVSTHLTSIYGKLGVNSRRAAARHALAHKLI